MTDDLDTGGGQASNASPGRAADVGVWSSWPRQTRSIVGTIKHAAMTSPMGSVLELPQRRARMVVIELLLKSLGRLEETPGFATPPRDGCAFVVDYV